MSEAVGRVTLGMQHVKRNFYWAAVKQIKFKLPERGCILSDRAAYIS